MITIENIVEGAIFQNKKGHKIEIEIVYKDYDNGSVIIKRYVHRNSMNCKVIKDDDGNEHKRYDWGHNTKYFSGIIRLIEGKKSGLIQELNNRGFKLKN